MKREQFEIEVCANSVLSAIEADIGGANRVELCDNLYEGGTTPSSGMILQTKLETFLQVFPIIRPRGGDFLYSADELNIMLSDIRHAHELEVDGFVFGCLTTDGKIDYENTARLINAAKGKPVTFHRAFDMTTDPIESLNTLIKLGVTRILTSGQENKAYDGIPLISELVRNAGDKIIIMAGSGISEDNIEEIIQKTNANSFHVSLRNKLESKMKFRRENIFMGGLTEIPEFSNKYTNSARVKSLIKKIEQF